MRQLSITPSITVTIGRHTRQYFAFVTTAPAELDSPATVTLHAGSFSEIVGFAAEPITPRPATDNSGPRGLRGPGERFTVGPEET